MKDSDCFTNLAKSCDQIASLQKKNNKYCVQILRAVANSWKKLHYVISVRCSSLTKTQGWASLRIVIDRRTDGRSETKDSIPKKSGGLSVGAIADPVPLTPNAHNVLDDIFQIVSFVSD